MRLLGRIDSGEASLMVWEKDGFGRMADGLPTVYLLETTAGTTTARMMVHGTEMRLLCKAILANDAQPYYPVRQ